MDHLFSPAFHFRPARILPLLAACAMLPAVAAHARGEAQAYPLGALDAWGYIMDGDSMRVQEVRSGGPMDDSGLRNRDEVIGVQVGGQFVPFKGNPKEYMRVLGEGIDASMVPGGSLRFKVRLGRDQGFTKLEPPHYGKFVAGHVIDQMTSESKENKNEKFFRGCAQWLLKKDKAGQLGAGSPMNPGLSWAGLALLCSPNPTDEAAVGKWVEAIQADWAQPGKRPNHGMGKDSYGQTLFSDIWGILLMSEYNWRHPSYDRAAVLAKACDEMAQLLLNPSYVYKEPSWHKHDIGTVDPGNPSKEYYKDRFAYVAGTMPNPRNLAVAWWCWSHCAATSAVQVNPQAMQVAHQYLLDLTMPADAKGARAFRRGKDGSPTFPLDRETAACLAQALVKSENRQEAEIGAALASFVNHTPMALMGDQSEFGILATCSLWLRTKGVPEYKARFNEWRWYLGLMMQSQADAHFCQLVADPPPWEPNPLGDKKIDANAIGAFLMIAPTRKLYMCGATKPTTSQVYEIGKPQEPSPGTTPP